MGDTALEQPQANIAFTFECYATAGFVATYEARNARNYNRIRADSDLATMEAGALLAKDQVRKSSEAVWTMCCDQVVSDGPCELFCALGQHPIRSSRHRFSPIIHEVHTGQGKPVGRSSARKH